MTFDVPFEPAVRRDSSSKRGGTDAVPAAAYRAGVTGADAYRAVRSAVRREGPILRVGNRFLRADRIREIAFFSAGNAAVSQTLALLHALRDDLTQGFVAAPDPLPPEIPFRSAVIPFGVPGTLPVAREVSLAARELTQNLGDRDMLVVVLSSGALAALATPPPGVTAADYETSLRELAWAGATTENVGQLVGLTADGAVAGQLAADARKGRVETLLIARDENPAMLGGSPTRRPTPAELVAARELVRKSDSGARGASLLARLDRWDGAGKAIRSEVARPVVVATAADAIRGAGDSVADRGWIARRAEISGGSNPEDICDRFLAEVERIASTEGSAPATRERRGLVVVATSTLGCLEGVREQPAIRRFLDRAGGKIPRRQMSVAAARTAGSAGEPGFPSGGVVGAASEGVASVARPLRMRGGITDVGTLLISVIPGEGGS